MIPEQVAQPALGHDGEVVAAAALAEPAAEVIGLDEPGLAGLLRAVVDALQALRDPEDNHPGMAGQRGLGKVGQGRRLAGLAEDRQALRGAGSPPGRVERLRVHVHAPLDLRLHQGPQPHQVDGPVLVDRGGRRAPPPERHLVVDEDGDGQPLQLEDVRPARGQADIAGLPGAAVADLVAGAKSRRGLRQQGTGGDLARAITRDRLLGRGPLLKAVPRRLQPVCPPPGPVTHAQLHALVRGHALWADAARPGAEPGCPLPDRCRADGEAGQPDLVPPECLPLALVRSAQPSPGRHALAPGHLAAPPVDQVARGNPDQVRTVERVESRGRDERGQQLQPVTAGPAAVAGLRQGQVKAHGTSFQT